MNISTLKTLVLVLLPVFMGVIGQIFLKQGMNMIGSFALHTDKLLMHYVRIFLNPYIWVGFVFYVLSSLIWLIVLSRVPLSFAYPMLSVGYIFVLFASALFFKEQVNLVRWLGVFLICAGVVFISRS